LPKHTHAKLLAGTLRPDRMRRLQRIEHLTTLPPAPTDLTPAALAAWERLGKLSIQAGSLTALDAELLCLAARTTATCAELEAQIASQGSLIASREALKANPALAALDRNRNLLLRLLDALALTPGGRERLPLPPPKTAENPFAWLD